MRTQHISLCYVCAERAYHSGGDRGERDAQARTVSETGGGRVVWSQKDVRLAAAHVVAHANPTQHRRDGNDIASLNVSFIRVRCAYLSHIYAAHTGTKRTYVARVHVWSMCGACVDVAHVAHLMCVWWWALQRNNKYPECCIFLHICVDALWM